MAAQYSINPVLTASSEDMDIGTWLKGIGDENIDPALRFHNSAKADTPCAPTADSNKRNDEKRANPSCTTLASNTIEPETSEGPQNRPFAINPASAAPVATANPWNTSPFPPTGPGVTTIAEQITYLNFSRAIATSSNHLLAALFSSSPNTIATVQLPPLTWQALALDAWAVLQEHCNRVRRVEQVLHDTCVALGGTYDPSRTIFAVNRVEEWWRDFVANGVEGFGVRECVGAVVEMVDAAAGMRVDGGRFGGGGMARARAGAKKLREVDEILGEVGGGW